jgi:ubiquinone/menaquinone biosynthesis C-methylase UbiE
MITSLPKTEIKVMSTPVQQGYNQWASSYDAIENKTRDLDKVATQKLLSAYTFSNVLEMGCGTGKNTEWLVQQAKQITAVDFVNFVQADLLQPWPFGAETYDLVTCNLVLEHIQNLAPVFREAARVLQPAGKLLISELHPYKQYSGSKARFQNEAELTVLECYQHSISEFFNTAVAAGFKCLQLNEWYDEDNKQQLPRLITFLFQKK